MSKKRISSNYITQLAPNEVFVFGSNLQGMHGGGAARLAYREFALFKIKTVMFNRQSDLFFNLWNIRNIVENNCLTLRRLP